MDCNCLESADISLSLICSQKLPTSKQRIGADECAAFVAAADARRCRLLNRGPTASARLMQPSPSAVIFAWTRMRRFECGAAAPSLEDEGSINFVMRGRERRGEHFTLALHDVRVPVAGPLRGTVVMCDR